MQVSTRNSNTSRIQSDKQDNDTRIINTLYLMKGFDLRDVPLIKKYINTFVFIYLLAVIKNINN